MLFSCCEGSLSILTIELYVQSPFAPLDEFFFSKELPRMFQYRETWHRQFPPAVLPKAVGRRSFARQQPNASYNTQKDCLSVMLNMLLLLLFFDDNSFKSSSGKRK